MSERDEMSDDFDERGVGVHGFGVKRAGGFCMELVVGI